MSKEAKAIIPPSANGALFHTNLEGLQILAYGKDCEIAEPTRRIQLFTASGGLDISFSMSVVLARSMAIGLMLTADAPYRPNLDKYEDRCLEFFGEACGGVISRDNHPETKPARHDIRIALSGDIEPDRPRAHLALTENKARALAAALLSAVEAIVQESIASAPAAARACGESHREDIESDWPGEISAIQEAAQRRQRERGNSSLDAALAA